MVCMYGMYGMYGIPLWFWVICNSHMYVWYVCMVCMVCMVCKEPAGVLKPPNTTPQEVTSPEI